MPIKDKSADHLFIFNRLRGQYVDTGPASKADRLLVHLSAGRMRIAKPVARSGRGVAAATSAFESAKKA